MKKTILILGSLALSLLIVLIPILLTCSIIFSCDFGIAAILTVFTIAETIMLAGVIYVTAELEE